MGAALWHLTHAGERRGTDRKNGRGRATAPIFLLAPQVKLLKRLELARDAAREVDGLPGLIVANWSD